MKRNLIISLVAAFAMVAGTASAASIKNTLHDFSGNALMNTTNFQICQPCHTPHNAQVAELIWNHQPTVQAYTMYSSYAFQGFVAAAQPDATSKKCLSCHDGSVALDAWGGSAGTAGNSIAGSARLGDGITGTDDKNDLSNDHPIGFDYTLVENPTDPEIRAIAAMPAGNIATELTGNNMMGCYTCHDVHNTDTPAGVTKLLRQTNVSSALCLTCHIK